MYCVKCGVKLQDGVKECPLCQTPVLINEEDVKEQLLTYSEKFPNENRNMGHVFRGLITAFMVAACLCCLFLCLNLYHKVSWSGYVMLGLALAWILFILPGFFRKWMPIIFLPIDFAAICGYLLYICLYNRGHWFLSFAFPVTMLVGVITFVSYILYHFLKKGHLFITGGLLIVIGCSFMLLEFFEHITFKTQMFLWSLYGVAFFALLGLFLILCGIIKPLKEYLEKKFFV